MKRKTRKALTDAELKAKAISRWENEGGAVNPPPAPRFGSKKEVAADQATTRTPDLTDRQKRSPTLPSKRDEGSGKPAR
jgi:hypothetical protein